MKYIYILYIYDFICVSLINIHWSQLIPINPNKSQSFTLLTHIKSHKTPLDSHEKMTIQAPGRWIRSPEGDPRDALNRWCIPQRKKAGKLEFVGDWNINVYNIYIYIFIYVIYTIYRFKSWIYWRIEGFKFNPPLGRSFFQICLSKRFSNALSFT